MNEGAAFLSAGLKSDWRRHHTHSPSSMVNKSVLPLKIYVNNWMFIPTVVLSPSSSSSPSPPYSLLFFFFLPPLTVCIHPPPPLFSSCWLGSVTVCPLLWNLLVSLHRPQDKKYLNSSAEDGTLFVRKRNPVTTQRLLLLLLYKNSRNLKKYYKMIMNSFTKVWKQQFNILSTFYLLVFQVLVDECPGRF